MADQYDNRPPVAAQPHHRLHPLVATAAGAVIVACGVGVAAMAGWLPHAGGTPQAQTAQAAPQALSAAPSAPVAQMPPPQQVAAAAPAPVVATAPAVAPTPAVQPAPARVERVAASVCQTCGHVTSVTAVRRQVPTSGIGAVGGAVAGGLLGNQFGHGNGRIATTLLGAAGGGLAGNAVERHVRTRTVYRVTVKMDRGGYRSFTYQNPPPYRQGESVRVVRGALRAG